MGMGAITPNRRGIGGVSLCTTFRTEHYGGLLMSERRSDCDWGEPDLWSNGGVFVGPSEPISIDPSLHIPLQQTTD